MELLNVAKSLPRRALSGHKCSVCKGKEALRPLLPLGEGAEIHVIVDNYCIHKRCDEYLEAHPNVFFHYTPTSASWLNQAEIWFNIMSHKVLRGASFDSTALLSEAIHRFVFAYNETSEPFVWSKREVTGS